MPYFKPVRSSRRIRKEFRVGRKAIVCTIFNNFAVLQKLVGYRNIGKRKMQPRMFVRSGILSDDWKDDLGVVEQQMNLSGHTVRDSLSRAIREVAFRGTATPNLPEKGDNRVGHTT